MNIRKAVFGLVVLALIATSFFARGFIDNIVKDPAPEKPSTTVEAPQTESGDVQERINIDRFPVVHGGLSSWKEVLDHAEKDQDFLRYLTSMTGLSFTEIQLLAKLESEGYVYSISLPKGTNVVNSGVKDGIFFNQEGPLEKEREALTELKGTPVILVTCGNPIIVKPKPKTPEIKVENPFVRTDNATDVFQTSARLRGYIEPKGSGQRWFQYGTTESFGRVTSKVTISSTMPVDAIVTDLQPGTRYHYRVVFERNGIPFYGETRTLVTDPVQTVEDPLPPPPTEEDINPIVRADNPPSVYSTSATLVGFVDPLGYTGSVWFEWGEGSSLDKKTNAFSVSYARDVMETITNLKPATKYSFRIVIRINGQDFPSNTRTFTTDF